MTLLTQRPPGAVDIELQPIPAPEPKSLLQASTRRVEAFASEMLAYVETVADVEHLRLWANYRLTIAKLHSGGRLDEDDRARYLDKLMAVLESHAPDLVRAARAVRLVDWAGCWGWAKGHSIDTELPPVLRELGRSTDAAVCERLVAWDFRYLAHHNPLDDAGWPPDGGVETRAVRTVLGATEAFIERRVPLPGPLSGAVNGIRLAADNVTPTDVARVRAHNA
jgi:hypothetical protein